MRDGFIFYRSFYESAKALNNQDKLALYEAIFELALNQKETKQEPLVNAFINLIKPQIEANNKRYENGKKGGRPKEKKPNENQKETKQEPKEKEKEKEKEKDNVKDKILEVVNSSSKLNRDSFIEWLEYKKFKYQVNSINKLIEMLTQYDSYTQKEIIDNSIMNNYKGLFEPKKKQSASLNLYEQNKQSMQSFLNRINGQEIIDSEVM